MAKIIQSINEELREWISQQKIFFVGSAPIKSDGHVNISPKGGDCFRVLGDNEIAYCDYTGSGIETAAHVQENSRIVIMFCSFEGAPKIVRFHGIGHVIKPGSEKYNNLASNFPHHQGTRLIVSINVKRIASSCGYSVPFFKYIGERDVLDKWTKSKGDDGLKEYRKMKNSQSIDGLPGI